MNKFILFGCSLLFASSLASQELSDYRWKNRLVLLFAPNLESSQLQRQLALFTTDTAALEERRMCLLQLIPGGSQKVDGAFIHTNNATHYYEQFRVDPTRFTIILVGLDGTEKFRSIDKLVSPSQIYGIIDQMPMRAAELRRGGGQNY